LPRFGAPGQFFFHTWPTPPYLWYLVVSYPPPFARVSASAADFLYLAATSGILFTSSPLPDHSIFIVLLSVSSPWTLFFLLDPKTPLILTDRFFPPPPPPLVRLRLGWDVLSFLPSSPLFSSPPGHFTLFPFKFFPLVLFRVFLMITTPFFVFRQYRFFLFFLLSVPCLCE